MKRPIVCTRLLGGLGNQMFQYAAGRALALRLDADLLLDLRGFRDYGLRSYALNAFEVEAPLYNPPPQGRLREMVPKRIVRLFESAEDVPIAGGERLRVFREPHFHVADEFFRLSGSCYIEGYWQSPRYFAGCETVIRRDFNLDRFVTPDLAGRLESVADPASCSVHFRRGDYESAPMRAVHGLCGADYYSRARDLVMRLQPDARFYVFSDDPAAARAAFAAWPRTEFVEGLRQHEDMLLMSRCRFHVIANSSFSWWGAWLDPRPDKVVIAPRNWFARPKLLETYVFDLFPAEWILL